MIRKENIVTKIEKLHREYESSRKVAIGDRRLKSRKKRILRYFSTTSSTWHTGMPDHDDHQEDKEFLLAQRDPGRRGRMGGVDSALCCSGDEAISSLGKGRCFLRPQQEEAAASSSGGAARVSPSSSSNTSVVVSDEKYGAVGGASPGEAGETGHEEHRLSSTGGHAGSNQADRSFRDIRAELKPHVA
ncbi:hypothetical protein GWK47_054668 [Chionoecetes opilio]|uniref:Uncharacterized protein n=1 Tax=Chionoecetes opilio TaxID=41210 RepID=A0A8J4XZT2_CHIOP|nr:hypothetical protein GWK47_054668 [Chionoecetes opilio]